MKKQLLYRAAASTVMGLGLLTGVAGAQTGTISTTGPDSFNRVSSRVRNTTHVDNFTRVDVDNENVQTSSTGDAKTAMNTTGGGATSGAAANSNALGASVGVDNSAAAMAAPAVAAATATGNSTGNITNTGPDSTNLVSSRVSNYLEVDNTTCVEVDNTNVQTATTGDASVYKNTTGGSATTGAATNTNATTISVNVTN